LAAASFAASVETQKASVSFLSTCLASSKRRAVGDRRDAGSFEVE